MGLLSQITQRSNNTRCSYSQFATQKSEKYLVTIFLFSVLECIEFVQKKLKPPFRPEVENEDGADERIIILMKACWQDISSKRPTIDHVKHVIRQVNKEK